MKIMNKRAIMIVICSILILSSTAVAQTLQASTDRYSLFAPWINKASAGSLSSDFKAYALLLDDSGKPLSGVNITFEIWSPVGLVKATKYNFTQQNGLASVSYDTNADFTAGTDTDYGTWVIKAFRTGSPTVTDSTNMRIEAGAGATAGTSCGKNVNCHHEQIAVSGGMPLSPYTDGYGSTSTKAVATHKKSAHTSRECYQCHSGYAATKTGNGYTGDVHKSMACDFCHGNFTYITGTGNGIPKMPSCSQCHPVYNGNVKNISTLATLVAGPGISVYSYNYDTKTPLAAHNSTSGVLYSLTKSVPCIVCHGPAHNNSKPSMSAGNSDTENEQCYGCHTTRATTHKSNTNCVSCHLQDAHNVSKIGGGDKDCISCHDIGKSVAKVDVSKINSTNSIHINLNSNGNTGGLIADNRICWGCHTNNTVSADNVVNAAELPSGDHPNGYNTPKKCDSCHIQLKFGALPVDVHYSGSSIIKTKSYSNVNDSCVNCHNKTEMVIANSDPGGPKSIYASVSHYGDNKTGDAPYNSGISANCAYCHNGSSVFTTEMIDPTWNSSIKNHSAKVTNPSCADCHNTGRIHSSTLTKPAVNSTLCSNCHIGKDKHNGTVECAKCHLSSNKNIHPVQYLLGSGTWSTAKTNAVNCTDCHQGTGMSGFVAPIIPGDLKHSSNVSNGTIWGNYWTSETGACLYCHSDTKHNNTGLGKVSALLSNPSNTKNGLLTNTEWCADCHRDSGNSNYKGDQWSPAPPTLSVTSNHNSMTTYKDENCKLCHTINGAYSETPKNYSHSLNAGSGGGGDCSSCHASYSQAVDGSRHNKTLNTNAPDCIDCHTGYDTAHAGLVVNETTCRICHSLEESHAPGADGADCTDCHFANTTQKFSLDQSLYAHNHELTVEYNFYNYNMAGIPLSSNSGAGKGMFPYYTCTLTCHGTGASSVEEEVVSWNESAHARSLRMAGDNNVYCSRCKSPPNYNVSTPDPRNATIAASDWQGIQCRVCHNLHNDTYSGGTLPLAFYNATASSQTGSAVYDKVADSTALCVKCHTGTTHDSKFAGPHKTTYGLTCASCHANSTLNSETHKFDVVNSATGKTGCEACHNTASHTWSQTSQHTGKVTCEGCHDKTVSKNATGYAVSSDNNYGLYKDPVTNEWSSYKMSHGTPATWPLHNISKNVTCNKCHGTYSLYNGTTKQNTLIASEATGGADCKSCHDIGAIGATTKINFSAANDTSSAHKKLNSGATTSLNAENKKCWACHGSGTEPTGGHPTNYLTPLDCPTCHTGTGSYSAPMATEHNQVGNDIQTPAVNCSQCHDNTGMYIGGTGVGSVKHYFKDVTNTVTTPYGHSVLDTSNCLTCHKGQYTNDPEWGSPVNITTSPRKVHTDAEMNCDSCHNDGTVATLANVDFHNASLKVPTGGARGDNCIGCHSLAANI